MTDDTLQVPRPMLEALLRVLDAGRWLMAPPEMAQLLTLRRDVAELLEGIVSEQ